MKLACQENLVPGESLHEKLENLARYGYEGIEFWGKGLLEQGVDEPLAVLRGHSVKPAAVCAGFRGSLLSADRAERDQAVADIRLLLEAAARLGAAGLIVVPVFGPPKLNDLSPWKTAVELELELLATLWAPLAEYANRLGTLLLLEPLHRFETHLFNRLEQGAAFLERVNTPGTTLMADFWHMQIEEADIAAALRKHRHLIAHIHVADSNRREPGQGHMDFRSGLQVLRETDYTGWISLEVSGFIEQDRAAALTAAARHLREAMA